MEAEANFRHIVYSIGRWNDNDERSRAFSDRNVTENGATQTKQRAKQEKLKQYETFCKKREITSLKKYRDEIKEGFSYLKKEKGIRNIYLYMSVTSGASDGINIVTQAYYQTQTWLSVTMLGFLKSAEMLGRVCSGYFQYKMEIPPKKRYRFIKFVYTFYDTMDAFLLWMPYPLMLLNRFFVGR